MDLKYLEDNFHNPNQYLDQIMKTLLKIYLDNNKRLNQIFFNLEKVLFLEIKMSQIMKKMIKNNHLVFLQIRINFSLHQIIMNKINHCLEIIQAVTVFLFLINKTHYLAIILEHKIFLASQKKSKIVMKKNKIQKKEAIVHQHFQMIMKSKTIQI